MPSFKGADRLGKTGTYDERNADGTFNSRRQTGWPAVGRAERDGERLAFAYLIRENKKSSTGQVRAPVMRCWRASPNGARASSPGRNSRVRRQCR